MQFSETFGYKFLKEQEMIKMKLVLLRHGESEWNRLNLFTGWTDVILSNKGIKEAADAGNMLKGKDYDFDICYTSFLKRAVDTLNVVLDTMDRAWLPVVKDWKLNERHYGALQGLNKAETAEKYGEEQVKIWRRSFDVRPPALEPEDPRNPQLQKQYRNVEKTELPLAESLKDTIARVIPYYENVIKEDMLKGKRVLLVAHGNSIRALVKYFENLSEDEIMGVNIPTGIPLVYEFDDDFNMTDHYYLGDQSIIETRMKKVAEQGKAK